MAEPAEPADGGRERGLRCNGEAGSTRDKIRLHGVLIEIFRLGILLTGESGCGKSAATLELIGRGHRLVADDCVEVERLADGGVEGSCPGTLGEFLAVRGLGILNVRHLFGASALCERKSIDLIIKLGTGNPDPMARLRGVRDSQLILEVAIPRLELPAVPSYNLAAMIECAARDHGLRLSGYHAEEDFARRLRKIMAEDSPCE